jgi:hypothetical protein
MARWSDGGPVEPLDHATVRSWRVGGEARALLSEVGLPEFGSFFIPCPQAAEEPLLGPYYILGRESVDQHPHSPPIDISCGCGYFGVSAVDGGVWQLFPDGEKLPVNSNLPLFYYFLNKVGGAWPRLESDLPERIAVRRAEAMMRRIVHRDPILTSGVDSFWRYIFMRPWG